MADTNVRKKPLPVDKSLFDRVIEDGAYYVDKTLFIRDLIDNAAEAVLCTRPRRFGKTLNQTMLKCFFEDTAPIGGKDTRTLFNGLKIEEAGERYMEYQGKYPVVFLSLKEAKMRSFDGSYDKLTEFIAYEFQRHSYVTEKISGDSNLDMFKRLSSRTGSINDYSTSLRFLSNCLENYHGRKAIIIIDEYDVPLENAWSRGFYQEMIDFIRPLLSSALKDNPHLQLAVMTGCLRISKESIFTGLNNLAVVSILSDSYSEHFGFTQIEVDAMLEYYGLESKMQIIKDWYNGYLFGNTVVYNPLSAVCMVNAWTLNINRYPESYWVNTSGNDIVRQLADTANAEMKTDLETLIAGGKISKPVHEDITYEEISKDKDKKPDNFWNFLFFTGYLKKVGESVDHKGRRIIDMQIPNKELHIIFEDKVQEWFMENIAKKDLDIFFNAVLSGDAETFQSELSKLLAESISFMDNAENFYHGFMAGALSMLDGYVVKSNRESGDGRSDLVLYSANGVDNKAVIFELKSAKEFDKLPTACEEAIKQIEEKNYAAYWDKEGYKSIVKYGIGFYKKRCMVLKG